MDIMIKLHFTNMFKLIRFLPSVADTWQISHLYIFFSLQIREATSTVSREYFIIFFLSTETSTLLKSTVDFTSQINFTSLSQEQGGQEAAIFRNLWRQNGSIYMGIYRA